MPDNEKTTPLRCTLCEREVSYLSKHHIIPKSEGGRETVELCSPCHATLHRFFRNRTLAREKSTLEAIRADLDIQTYLAWVRKQRDGRIAVRPRRNRY
ncbi:MAG TPA: HNH endonuclease [Aggregatilineales bacterium]|nr:HNH endonuclease [Anaerolineales bacterium]HRE47590.1 HNH endonuclease [Aggregatilineales bacterium]